MNLKNTRQNAAINVMGWLIPAVVLLILTPVLVEYLGTDGFGVLIIIQVLTGYMSILNFGFSEAIIKQMAECYEDDTDKAVRIMWSGLGLFLLAGTAGGITIYLLAPWITHDILEIPDNLLDESTIALQIGAFVFLLQMVAEYYRGIAIGCNQFMIPNVSRIIRISLSSILIAYTLFNDGGLIEVMWATLIGLIVGLVINGLWMQRILPIRLAPGNYRSITYELLHFGKHIFFSRLANALSSKLNQLVLGSTSSVTNVSLYAVPTRAADAAATILHKAIQVFFPGFSSMDKVTEIDRIKQIYFSVISIQLFITMPLLLLVLLEGTTILGAWINEDFAENSGGIIPMIAITYFMSSLTNLPTFTAMSFNLPQLISKYSIIRAVIVLIFVYPLIKFYGLAGAAAVLLIAEIPAIVFLYEATKRTLSCNFYDVLKASIAKHALIFFTLFSLYEYFIKQSDWYNPWLALPITIGYVALAIVFSTISKSDNKRILKMVAIWN